MSGKVFYNLTALQTTKIFFLSSNCTLLVLGAPGDIMYPWTIPVPMYYFCMYMFIFTITCSSTFPSIGTEISDLFSWLIVFCFFEFVVLCRYLCLWLSFFFWLTNLVHMVLRIGNSNSFNVWGGKTDICYMYLI